MQYLSWITGWWFINECENVSKSQLLVSKIRFNWKNQLIAWKFWMNGALAHVESDLLAYIEQHRHGYMDGNPMHSKVSAFWKKKRFFFRYFEIHIFQGMLKEKTKNIHVNYRWMFSNCSQQKPAGRWKSGRERKKKKIKCPNRWLWKTAADSGAFSSNTSSSHQHGCRH